MWNLENIKQWCHTNNYSTFISKYTLNSKHSNNGQLFNLRQSRELSKQSQPRCYNIRAIHSKVN